MTIAAIYARLSDEDKNKINKGDDSESIQNQILMITNYAKSQGWLIYDIYKDDDYSGVDNDRPDFKRVLADAKSGKFHVIISKSQSRFTRDMEIVEGVLHGKFIEWGIRFIGIVDNVDTGDQSTKKSRQINGLVNEWYCEDVSVNIRKTFRTKMQEGQFVGAYAAFGYKRDESDRHKIIVDEPASKIVKYIFDLYLKGNGVQEISKILTKEGIPKPSIYKNNNGIPYKSASCNKLRAEWGRNSVLKILRNEWYIGTLIQGRYTTVSYKNKKRIENNKADWIVKTNNHEAIISPSVFYEVQELLTKRRRSPKCEAKPHLFRSKLYCADCGSYMRKYTLNHKRQQEDQYICFDCNSYSVHRDSGVCTTSHKMKYLELLNFVESEFKKLIDLYLADEECIKNVSSSLKRPAYETDIINLGKEIDKIERQIEEQVSAISNLYMDKTKGVIDQATFRMILQSINSSSDSLKTIKLRLEDELKQKKELIHTKINFSELARNFNLNGGLTQKMINQAIKRIEIGKVNGENPLAPREITIYWKI